MPRPLYIEFDSTYRDRNRFPSPGNFIMPISQTGRQGKAGALDPVCDASVEVEWSSNEFSAVGGTRERLDGQISNIGVDPLGGVSSGTTLVLDIDQPGSDPQKAENYYAGAVMYVAPAGTAFPLTAANSTTYRITASKYLGLHPGSDEQMRVTITPTLPSTVLLNSVIQIKDPTDLTDTSNPQFFVPSGAGQTHAYTGRILYNETVGEFRAVTNYDSTTHILTVDATTNPVTGWSATDNYTIRRAAPILVSAVGASTTTTITLTGADPNGDYVGDYVRVRATIYGNAETGAETNMRRIIAYSSNVATVSPAFDAVPAGTAEILQFTHDNLNPFTYSGSTVSQQEMTCYELELLNLVLPNLVLDAGEGGRIAFYPYVYLEISNESASGAGAKHTIYSNNPNATRAVFRASVTDVPQPTFSSFVRIDGGGMVQTIKFKPNDDLRIRVTLPNGDVFDTQEAESFAPLRPNPHIQISGLMSIRRTEESHASNTTQSGCLPQQPSCAPGCFSRPGPSGGRFA
jgi:hypothetical protein